MEEAEDGLGGHGRRCCVPTTCSVNTIESITCMSLVDVCNMQKQFQQNFVTQSIHNPVGTSKAFYGYIFLPGGQVYELKIHLVVLVLVLDTILMRP